MIVKGGTSPPREELVFGNTAATVLRDWPNPLLLLAS